jgi:polyphenol oxidase
MMCTQPRVALTVRVADCVPVLLYAPAVQAIAAVHAGWRGTAEHITREDAEH